MEALNSTDCLGDPWTSQMYPGQEGCLPSSALGMVVHTYAFRLEVHSASFHAAFLNRVMV